MNSTISRILVSGTFLASVIAGINAMAQATTPHTAIPGTSQQAHKAGENAAESNPACERILTECKKLGFVAGQWKKDNGLWHDCFHPVVHGGTPTREGKPINVPVSSSDVQACRAAVEHHKGAEQPKQ